MRVWIMFGCASLIIATLFYRLSVRMMFVNRNVERQKVEQAVHQMYDTPENIAACVDKTPEDPVPAIQWIRLAEQASDWAEVVVRARLVTGRFPHLFQGQYMLARALGVTGDLVGSRRIMRKLYRKWPQDQHLMELDVFQAREKGDWIAAERHCDQYRRAHSFQPAPYYLQIEILLHMEDISGAERILLLADKEFPENQKINALWDQLEAQLAVAQQEPGNKQE